MINEGSGKDVGNNRVQGTNKLPARFLIPRTFQPGLLFNEASTFYALNRDAPRLPIDLHRLRPFRRPPRGFIRRLLHLTTRASLAFYGIYRRAGHDVRAAAYTVQNRGARSESLTRRFKSLPGGLRENCVPT